MSMESFDRRKKLSLIDRVIRFYLQEKLLVFLIVAMIIVWGLMVAPFDWDLGGLPRDSVSVDAIPDIGENQQIIFSQWPGRSPQDIEDQISYPLTVSLLGIPGVKSIRSYSMFGFSSIYLIFNEDIEFYWSRSRILEKLNSLPAGTLPAGIQPALGPDATALGQIFWYTLEGRDKYDQPTGGWDLNELRSIQDWYVRYALMAADGISEVASVGGFVQEYQIDVDPDAMRAFGITLESVFEAVKMSNVDVGARTIEVNKVEYVIRGLGFLENIQDIENTVVGVKENVPVYIRQIAQVNLGPALRRGVLDKGGAEAVGGVAVARYGKNPLQAINNLKEKIKEISPGLPSKTLADGTVSQVKIVPFYDRTGLIQETLGTLNHALRDEILVTVIVVLFMVLHFRSSILVAGLLPLAVLMCFIAMKLFGVEANIMALSGIAIAIGTMVDMGIIVCENILRHLNENKEESPNYLDIVYRSASEVGGAVTTAIATTIVSFLPVFTMSAAEGKLFRPLAYTKTFALLASVTIALLIIPAFAQILFTTKVRQRLLGKLRPIFLLGGGLLLGFFYDWHVALVIIGIGIYYLIEPQLPQQWHTRISLITNLSTIILVAVLLAHTWLPLGPQLGIVRNFLFVIIIIATVLGVLQLPLIFYDQILGWCLRHKALFLSLPIMLVLFGATIWLGFSRTFAFVPKTLFLVGIKHQSVVSFPLFSRLAHAFPGLGKEFMPPLDEGSFLFMPTTMPHVSIGEALDILQKQDMAINSIPEVEVAVGKIGRVESSLDPAPVSMIETVINYKSEYMTDKNGNLLLFRFDPEKQAFIRDPDGKLIEDSDGQPFRQWREHIKNPKDIWDEIVMTAQIPGVTSAPYLQPIAARIVMLQSGMRAPMGIKVRGPDLKTIEQVALELEAHLKKVPSVEPSTVIADRVVGKPYLEIDIDREAIARYGIHIRNVQDVIEVAIGGRQATTTVEGRERYPVRVRYLRELRDSIESLGNILVAGNGGVQIPLKELASINYTRGPMVIKSEDTFLTAYVIFDKRSGLAEVDVVEESQRFLAEKVNSGELVIPAGVSYAFAGNYENQVRAQKKLSIVLPLALFIILILLYFEFRSLISSLIVFSGIFVAWSGGFIMIWLYGRPWFLNFNVFTVSMQDLFQVHPVNLSVAVWVGFIALFGIASDDGVVMTTYLNQVFRKCSPHELSSVAKIRQATIEAGKRRLRPCLMTTGTTILALLPVLTSHGKGADVLVPMAIPSFGGMMIELVTLLVVPTLYCAVAEIKLKSISN